MSLFAFVLAITVALAASAGPFLNEYDRPLAFSCPSGQVIKSINSIHHNYFEDRIWKFTCGFPYKNIPVTNCQWTPDYINAFQQPLSYSCPADSILAGVQSYHENKYEDRRWKFLCCSQPKVEFHTYSCSITDWLNKMDQPLNYAVPQNYDVITGWFSLFNDYTKDRIHKMMVCKFDRFRAH